MFEFSSPVGDIGVVIADVVIGPLEVSPDISFMHFWTSCFWRSSRVVGMSGCSMDGGALFKIKIFRNRFIKFHK